MKRAVLVRLLEASRWVFLPLGLAALTAVGVHAAADMLDDQLLWRAEWLDVQVARGLTAAWELSVDFFFVLPALSYDENARPSKRSAALPFLLLQPLLTGVFVLGGARAVGRLVESTLFVGLVGDVAPAPVAERIAGGLGTLSLVLVVASHGWRAVLHAFQHAKSDAGAALGAALAMPVAAAFILEVFR